MLLALTLATLAAAALALLIGSVTIDLGRALGAPDSPDHAILFDHRLPRMLMGLATGAVLAASGAALQGLLRNALADPFILGVSGGAALGGAAVGLTGLAAFIAAPLGGFAGAVAALFLVTALASRRRGISPLHMLLVGVVVNAFAGALLMFLQALAGPAAVQRVVLRLMGSLAVDPSQPLTLPLVLAASALGLALTMAHARDLDLLALGDDGARALGVDPDRLRRRLFVALSVPIGAVVATTGLIGFVGLIVPHGVRLALGPDHRLLLPASALAGGVFVLLADLLVRTLTGPLGTELPVGVLTTAVGGPVFLWLLRRESGATS
ncbi:MAG: iron ABC transporter permease [Deltaproteobacteria bacterium]|nr:iron ABC transporter permease [Deltaproteobacteria bacterium]MCB9787443.1 iron ABC transporter permease [Deltaproteobacteria bacterium]